jgi:hypothetical protein
MILLAVGEKIKASTKALIMPDSNTLASRIEYSLSMAPFIAKDSLVNG